MKFVMGTLLSLCMMASQSLFGGVVFHLESKSPSGEPEVSEVHAEGTNLKMSTNGNRGQQDGRMIYRGDRREMVIVDDSQKSYMVLDMETLKSIAGTVSSAMSQMEEALKNVPEGQRAMMEKMMKDRMPKSKTPEVPKIEVRKTGKKAKHSGYSCVRYDVIEDGKKIREMWITPWSKVEGGKDVASAFNSMGEFFEELIDAFNNMPGAKGSMEQMKKNMFAQMKELEGFPVVTRDFNDDGSLEKETTLKSAKRMELDPDAFEPPAGYKRQTMMGGR